MSTEVRKTILVVDDDARNRSHLRLLLEVGGYTVRDEKSGDAGLESAKRDRPDLILLDAMMPVMDGFQVATALKQDKTTQSIPVIMITALADRESRLRALNCGVEEFLEKPVDRAELAVRVRNLLRLKAYNDLLADYNHILEQQVRERSQQLSASHLDTIYTIVRAAEFRDEETGAHIKRISFYTQNLATQLGMGREFADTIFHASPLHDIGKIGIPDHILLKPGPHDPDEWAIMKTHTTLGAKILGKGGGASHYTRMGAEIALGHHEKWGGNGYPGGAKGEDIPISARIMAICDVYDALRSRRPYKPAYPHTDALRIIFEGDGRTSPNDFDPRVLEAFRQCSDVFADIFSQHAD